MPPLPAESNTGIGCTSGRSQLRRKTFETLHRNHEPDLRTSIGEHVDIGKFRAVVRHGARIIGLRPTQVKTSP